MKALPSELSRRQVLSITLLLALAAAVLRFYRLDHSAHPDSLLWIPRVRNFWLALGAGDFADTYQAPHPGVMLMWLAGGVMRVSGALAGPVDEHALLAMKIPGALLGTLAAALTFPLLLASLGQRSWRAPLILAVLLVTEPFLIEQSRMAHLDMLGLGFIWLGLLVSLLAYERARWPLSAAAGALFAAGCLTKLSLSPVPAAFMLVLVGASLRARLRDRRGLAVAAVATGTALLTSFVLWPALWTDASGTLRTMLGKTSALVQRGHAHRVDGEETAELGATFFVRIVSAATPFETALLALCGLGALWSARAVRRPYAWLLLAFVPYLVMISIAPKKLSRYALPLFPVLALLSSATIEWALPRLQQRLRLAPGVLIGAFCVLCLGRFTRAVASLPSAKHCTAWPGITCRRPDNMYFMRELALAIRDDWGRAQQPGNPQVFVGGAVPMAPWQKVHRAKTLAKADYVVTWDTDYLDAQGQQLSPKFRKQHRGKLGAVVSEVSYRGQLVAKLQRGPSFARGAGAD